MEALDAYASSTTTYTSNEDGFYPYIGDGGVEPGYEYRLGGLHPVEIGDFIGPRTMFDVFYKLGYSSKSTSWLCWDRSSSSWKALKILAADISTPANPELSLLTALAEFSEGELNDNYVLIPSEHFWMDGVNGRHLCFVSAVLGAHGCITPSHTSVL